MNALTLAPPAPPSSIGPALELFADMTRQPDRFIVHASTDNRNAPLICRGEIVVVDTGGPCVTGGWIPTDGGLFLIEYRSPPMACERYARHSRSIVQTFTDQRGRWWAGSLRRGMQGREFFCADGPYADELALADKLIGKVIGLYKPTGAVQ
ncbi:MAG: hypothetical protein GY736_20040 [Sphingomonas sp.]|uniref:hypothetical protein n=1 Tax=Sphingomonas sp. TaxID=28214 RepID=UPI00258814D8|nr:hypothetical protein [Sphingomonas sp.]MCP4028581.1 hypothetical protein [Sphingomonas sp.]